MKSIPVILSISFVVMFFLTGCGDQPKGACVFVSGYGCVDDQTEGQCSTTGGTHWNEGETCAELGFGGSPVSTLVLSEIYLDSHPAGFSLGWIELLNSGTEPIDLSGYRILTADDQGQNTSVALTGIIESCGTFVIGSPGSPEDNGSPSFDQIADLSSLKQAAAMVALVSPGYESQDDCPVSVVCFNPNHSDQFPGSHCTDNIAYVGQVAAGYSVERESWPADHWRTRAVPAPNFASSVFGCDISSGKTPTWSPVRGVY